MNHTKSEKRKKEILESQLRKYRQQKADLKSGKRKTIDVYYVQGDFGYGFEDVAAYDTRIEALEGLREYNDNDRFVPYRYIVKRVKKANFESGNYAKGGGVKHECGLTKDQVEKLLDWYNFNINQANKSIKEEKSDKERVAGLKYEIMAYQSVIDDLKFMSQKNMAQGGELMDADTDVDYARGGETDFEIITNTYNDVIGDINRALESNMVYYGDYKKKNDRLRDGTNDDFMKDFYTLRNVLGKEISRLSELKNYYRGYAKGGKVKIGDELTMVDKYSPAYGRKGKVTRFIQDGVEVDFGRGDKYGITFRRIKGDEIVYAKGGEISLTKQVKNYIDTLGKEDLISMRNELGREIDKGIVDKSKYKDELAYLNYRIGENMYAKGGDVKDKKFTFNKVEDKERFYEGGNISQVSKVGDPDYPTYEL